MKVIDDIKYELRHGLGSSGSVWAFIATFVLFIFIIIAPVVMISFVESW